MEEAETYSITLINRDGRVYHVPRKEVLLDTLEKQGVSLPYGCRYGGCISCAAKLLRGNVEQNRALALNSRQLADGYILLCVANPESDCILEVGVESHDRLYRNPFKDPLTEEGLKSR